MISLRSAELYRLELHARMPFRYGIATMTDVPQIIARLTFNLDGKSETGLAADLLPPKWFTKDPTRGLTEEIDEMLRVIRAAVRHARMVQGTSPFGYWRRLYAAQAAWAKATNLPPLLAHFGTSFVERALIHAVCRAGHVGAELRSAGKYGFLPCHIGERGRGHHVEDAVALGEHVEF